MKYLKNYKLFESESHYDDEPLTRAEEIFGKQTRLEKQFSEVVVNGLLNNTEYWSTFNALKIEIKPLLSNYKEFMYRISEGEDPTNVMNDVCKDLNLNDESQRLLSELNGNDLNESLFGEISRLNPKRKENDEKAYDLFQDMKEDFEKNGKNLLKVKINDNKGNSISFEELKLGGDYRLVYVFGKYHPTFRDINVGNREAPDRRIEINHIPFFIKFKKNELERAFNTKRIKMQNSTVKDTKTIDNPIHNPNISRNLGFRERPTESDREKMRTHDEIRDMYRISHDISSKIMKYFIKEYDKQYPNIGSHRSPDKIKDIQKGVEPIIKFIHVRNNEGEELTLGLRRGENEEELRSKLKTMSKNDYDKFWKSRGEEVYKEWNKKSKNIGIRWEQIVNNKLKNSGFRNLKPTKWKKFGFNIKTNQYNMSVDFMTKDMNKEEIEKNVKKFIEEDFGDYIYKDHRISDGFGNDSTQFISIRWEHKSIIKD